ncbi:MAG: ATP-binding protein [Acidobacteriota bacterium]
MRLSIALHEALANAICHGNLEVGSVLWRAGNGASRAHRLIEERLHTAPYADRRVHLAAQVTPQEATYVVRDEGPGFDPGILSDPTDHANLVKISGRGLFFIRMFMDEVFHDETGNTITMIKRRSKTA